jgi:hypothetical protein
MSRARIIAAFLATALAPCLAVTAAEAQQRRPLTVIVEGRSFLDAGKVAPVGSLNRHLFIANSMSGGMQGPSLSNVGRENLPDRFAGPNPFANSFWGPSLR